MNSASAWVIWEGGVTKDALLCENFCEDFFFLWIKLPEIETS